MRRKHKFWTFHEDACLRLLYHTATLKQLEAQLGRTRDAISVRASKMGLTTKKPSQTRQDEQEPADVVERKLALIDKLKRRTRWAA